MTSRVRYILVLLLPLACSFAAQPRTVNYRLQSPDLKTSVQVAVGKHVSLTVIHDARRLLEIGPVALELASGEMLGVAPAIGSARVDTIHETITPVVAEKRSSIRDDCRQLTIGCGTYSLIVRAYNDGVAYRFRTAMTGEITVKNEEMAVHLGPRDSIWFPEEESFLSHSERTYKYLSAADIADTQMCCLPAVVALPSGVSVAITEADLLDYPGLYLKGTSRGEPSLRAVLPAYPAEEQLVGDRTVKVTRREPFLARTRGTRDFPWRVFAVAEHDGDLVANDIVYRLGSPNALKETSWIRPGKVAWDWWNANNIGGVAFKSGVNTNTYKYYIDFAAANGLEYVIFDEGWSKPSDLFQVNPAMNMDTLFAYAAGKQVGIILWVTWNALDARMTEALDRFAAWGAKGIKVDFMQRDDQKMVNFYERVAREAAARHLLVDFHGAYKPTGLSRTYPNVLTREGVKGLEHSKWSADITPAHDVTLPFTRMFAGAMDYTPGAMRNAAKGAFQPIFEHPLSQGTRCHQLAMYVVYESPLQMLCDAPTSYLGEPVAMEFLRIVPTTWDETVVLNGKIGRYLTVARRQGDRWFVGAMTDWEPRDLTLDLGFLGSGPVEITAFEDGANADRLGADFMKRVLRPAGQKSLTIHLAPGGGWAAIVRPLR